MKKILKKIIQQKKSDRLGHAYLILGELLEKDLIKILEVGEPDTFRLRENPIKISYIRQLIHWIQLKPHSSSIKLAIIYQADNMTGESANALLKILEEPPIKSVIILQSQNKNRLLPTILSRCQIFKAANQTQDDLPPDYLTPDQIAKRSVKERFDYANSLAGSENLVKILSAWEGYFRNKMLQGEDELKRIRQISQSKDLLLTNSSVKLLLENLLLIF